MGKYIHVVGTGTIGEPFIDGVAGFADPFEIDLSAGQLTFEKAKPHARNRANIRELQKAGAKLAVIESSMDDFKKGGYEPDLTAEEARKHATVIFDCTPKAVCKANRDGLYPRLFEAGALKLVVAQGGAGSKFGPLYARGVNDVIVPQAISDGYLTIASCNTHAGAALAQGVTGNELEMIKLGVLCYDRRASDITQWDEAVLDPRFGVPDPKYGAYGAHQPEDVARLFQSIGITVNLTGNADKLPTQYMHKMTGVFILKGRHTAADIAARIRANRRIAWTEKDAIGPIFGFGRDHAAHGRILNAVVVCLPSIHVVPFGDDTVVIVGACTPQDGNPLISSYYALGYFLYPGEVESRMAFLEKLYFDEV